MQTIHNNTAHVRPASSVFLLVILSLQHAAAWIRKVCSIAIPNNPNVPKSSHYIQIERLMKDVRVHHLCLDIWTKSNLPSPPSLPSPKIRINFDRDHESRDGFDNVASLFLFLLLSSTPAHPAISQINRTDLLNLLAFVFPPFKFPHHAPHQIIGVIHPGVLQKRFCRGICRYLSWSHQRVLTTVTSIFRALQPFSCCSLDRIPSSALQRPVNTACIDHFSETAWWHAGNSQTQCWEDCCPGTQTT